MLSQTEKSFVYDKAFAFLIDNAKGVMPTPLEDICVSHLITLVPLSAIAKAMDATEVDVIKNCWYNENGHLMAHRGNGKITFKIAFNDGKTHIKRHRFTIAEELSHYILRHYENNMYSAFDRSLDRKLYTFHEESARLCALMLLCPPAFFYSLPHVCNKAGIMGYAGVSGDCAAYAFSHLQQNKADIQRSFLYDQLKSVYLDKMK